MAIKGTLTINHLYRSLQRAQSTSIDDSAQLDIEGRFDIPC